MRTLLVALLLTQSLSSLPLFACSSEPVSGKDLRTGNFASVNLKSDVKGTVVLFLSAKCPCSRSHEESLGALSKEFSGFQFVAVQSNTDEDETVSAFHFQQSGLPFPVIRDVQARIANQFGALKTPHAFIVGPQGQCWFNGGVDDTKDASKATKFFLKTALSDLVAGREPKEKNVRTLGCVIKR